MDEKKKLMVLIALVAVMACIGVFQVFKPHGGPPPPPPKTGSAPAGGPSNSAPTETLSVGKVTPGAKAPDGTEKPPVVKNPEVANELPPRDPFQVPGSQRAKVPQQFIASTPTPKPFPPRMRGSLSPTMPPLAPGNFPGMISGLPKSGQDIGQIGRPKEEPFGYKVVGAITGDRSAVVLQDAAGNQKLVPEGAAIDGDSRVKRVENGAVTIVYRGKKLRLVVGGISVDK
jgi:hypothetical protein